MRELLNFPSEKQPHTILFLGISIIISGCEPASASNNIIKLNNRKKRRKKEKKSLFMGEKADFSEKFRHNHHNNKKRREKKLGGDGASASSDMHLAFSYSVIDYASVCVHDEGRADG